MLPDQDFLQEGAIQHFWDVWKLFNIDLRRWDFSGIHFRAMPGQITKLLALFFAVAFGSSMDVVSPHTPARPRPVMEIGKLLRNLLLGIALGVRPRSLQTGVRIRNRRKGVLIATGL